MTDFQVGDRVRVLDHGEFHNYVLPVGATGRVAGLDGSAFVVVQWDDDVPEAVSAGPWMTRRFESLDGEPEAWCLKDGAGDWWIGKGDRATHLIGKSGEVYETECRIDYIVNTWDVSGPEASVGDKGTETQEETPEALTDDSVDSQDPFPVGSRVVVAVAQWDHDEESPRRIGTVESCPVHEEGGVIRSVVGVDPGDPYFGWAYSVDDLRKPIMYVSGPMTGLPEFNFPAFNIVADEFRAAGWEVRNPADKGIIDEWTWADYLRYDLREISECDAIYTLPGWRESKGARLEMHVASELGIEWLNPSGDDVDALGLTGAEDEVAYALSALAGECESDRLKGEVRSVSSTGGEKGVKPEAFHLVPWDAMNAVARVYGFGAGKYDDHNWRKGYSWGHSIASAFRHMGAFAMGEDYDPESGLPHPAHAVFHMLALVAWLADPEGFGHFDNRFKVYADAAIENGAGN